MDKSTTKSTKWTSLLLTPQKWKILFPSLQSRRAYDHEVDGPITKVYKVDEFNISPKVDKKPLPSLQSKPAQVHKVDGDIIKSTK